MCLLEPHVVFLPKGQMDMNLSRPLNPATNLWETGEKSTPNSTICTQPNLASAKLSGPNHQGCSTEVLLGKERERGRLQVRSSQRLMLVSTEVHPEVRKAQGLYLEADGSYFSGREGWLVNGSDGGASWKGCQSSVL